MDSEQVTIGLGEHSYTVDAVFHLFNTGRTTSEWVGFPKPGYVSVGPLSVEPLPFIRFNAWVDDMKIEFKEDGGDASNAGIVRRALDAYSSAKNFLGLSRPSVHETLSQNGLRVAWLVHHVEFSGHTRTTIRISYEGHYSPNHRPYEAAYYIVGTGRYWKNSIRKAVFIIDTRGVGGTENIRVGFPVAPGPRLIADSLVRFEIKDVEPWPAADLTIEILPH
ncbi:MAG: hypothetical protein V1792_24575 [Pseudomonadota bacterium]